jgi:hypothetical protein
MNEVSFKCLNGLGDKLVDSIGFYVLCKILNFTPYIEFNSSIHNYDWGNNRYDERLFRFPGLQLTDHNCAKYIDSYNPSVSLSPYKVYEHLSSNLENFQNFEDFSSYYSQSAKEIIQPSEMILSNIPLGIENAYGIHLRKSDKVKKNHCVSHENSINEFSIIINNLLNDVQEIINEEENPTFFIVSEDHQWKNDISNKIRGMSDHKKIEMIEIDYSVGDGYDNYSAVLDMFSLSKCKKIFQGVKYSTFSILAALLGNNKLINYSHCLQDDRECLIYVWNSVLEINGKKIFETEPYQYFTRGCLQFSIRDSQDS